MTMMSQNISKKDSLTETKALDIVDKTTETDNLKNIKTVAVLKDTIKINSPKKTMVLENWDPIRFNPYKKKTFQKFPFLIQFNDSIYSSPIEGKKVVTSRFGWRRGRAHRGIDIDLVTGDNVLAMLDGIVRFVRYSTGHGKTVIIRHYNGLETAYSHLSKYSVKVNDTVKSGQIIGKGGITGNARGSHLHLTTIYKGNYINPEYLFDFGKQNKIRKQQTWITEKWTTAQKHSSKRQSKLKLHNSYDEALTSQKQQNRSKIYIVKRGDTLYGISNRYHVSLNRLCKTNSIRKTSTLKIGQKLIITL